MPTRLAGICKLWHMKGECVLHAHVPMHAV